MIELEPQGLHWLMLSRILPVLLLTAAVNSAGTQIAPLAAQRRTSPNRAPVSVRERNSLARPPFRFERAALR